MVRIPTIKHPSFTQDVVLGGVPYRVSFMWSDRAKAWSIGLWTVEGEPIVTGVKVVLGYPLLAQFARAGQPPGEIWVIDPTGGNDPVEYDDLVDRVSVIYDPE